MPELDDKCDPAWITRGLFERSADFILDSFINVFGDTYRFLRDSYRKLTDRREIR